MAEHLPMLDFSFAAATDAAATCRVAADRLDALLDARADGAARLEAVWRGRLHDEVFATAGLALRREGADLRQDLLLTAAAIERAAEDAVAILGPHLQDALDRLVRAGPDGGFCPWVRGEDVTRHAERGRVLAEWVGAVGQAFTALDDGFVGYLPGTARSAPEEAITAWVEALGAFPLLEQSEAWRAGIAHARSVEDLVAAGHGQQAADALAQLADFEDSPAYLRAALLALGDLDDLEDRIDAVTDRGHPVGRFLGGVVDWEGLQDDPVRWAGQLVPDVAAAVFTGGTAAATTRGTSATRATVRGLRTATRLPDPVEALRHLGTVLQVDVASRIRTIGGRALTWTPWATSTRSATSSGCRSVAAVPWRVSTPWPA